MRDTCINLNESMIIHFALFLKPGSTFKSISIAANLPENIANLFGDQEPDIMSYPPEFPNDAPRLIFKNNDAELVFSFTRIDFHVKFKPNTSDNTIRDLFTNTISYLSNEHNLKFERLGFVLQFQIKDDIDIDTLKNIYITSDKLRDLEGFQLSWMKQIDIDGFKANRWVRLHHTGNLENKEQYVLIDTNTLAKDEHNINATFTDNFIKNILEEIRGDLNNVIEWYK